MLGERGRRVSDEPEHFTFNNRVNRSMAGAHAAGSPPRVWVSRVPSFFGTVIASEARQSRWGKECYGGKEIATSLRSSR